MAATLFDTNALIYYYTNESFGTQIDKFRSEGPSFLSDWGVLELHSVLARFVREGHISAAEFVLLIRQIEIDYSSLGWLRIQPVRRRFMVGGARLIEEHGVRAGRELRAPDCMHLLAALDLRSRQALTGQVKLVTGDQKLAGVAQLAGIDVALIQP